MPVSRDAAGLITVTGTQAGGMGLDTTTPGSSTMDELGERGVRTVSLSTDPVRRISLAVEARFVVASGTFQIPSETDTLFIDDDGPSGNGGTGNGAGGGIEVRSLATLDIGGTSKGPGSSQSDADGVTYTVGTAVVFAKKGANASDIATAAIYGLPGSTVRIRGCTIMSAAASRFDGGTGNTQATEDCILDIQDVVWYNGRDDSTGYFAPRLFTDNYRIRNLTLVGGVMQVHARAAASVIEGVRIERSHGGISVTGGLFGASTDFFTLKGLDGKHNSAKDAAVFNGKKLRVRNSRTGSDVNVDLQAFNHTGRSFGCIEVDQEVRFISKDTAGNPVQHARFHYEDFVDGRYSALTMNNPDIWSSKNTYEGHPSSAVDYTQQETGSQASGADGIAEFVGDDAILLATKVYNAPPASAQTPLVAKDFRYRGLNNDNSDIMPFYADSYLHIGASLSVVCKSENVLEVDVTWVDDPSVTEQDRSVVAAYAGLAVDHSTDIVTYTTTPRTLDALYDWLKYENTLADSEIHPTRATMVANADGTVLDLGSYSLVVGAGGVLTVGDKFRSIRTTGTITTTGGGQIGVGFQDSTGKTILINLGAQNTALVYSTTNPTTNPTYVAPAAGKTTHSIKVGAASMVHITAKRLGHDYRKYSVNAAHVGDISVDLPQNLNVDTDDIIDMQNLLHWPQLATGVYGGNIYFDKAATPPHTLRLGNVELSGSPILTRALFDRRMLTQPAMEATHAHDDAGRGRAYDIYRDRIRIDDEWVVLGRQSVTVPPNPPQGDGRGVGTLWKVSTWGLYVTRHDDIRKLIPPLIDDYVVIIDPLTTPYAPTPGDLSLGSQAVVNTPAFRDALGGAAADAIRPELEEVDDEVKALGQQIRSLPIDELLQVDTIERVVPLTTDMANVWSGVPGTADSVVGGHLQVDIEGATEQESGNVAGTLDLEGFVPFTVTQPGNDRIVLRVTVRCQALGGSDRSVSPDLLWEWVAPAAGIPERRALGFLKATHPVTVLAPTAGLGPSYTIEYDMGRAATFRVTDAAVRIAAKVRGADDYLRVVITSVEWVTRHEATVDDFKADLSAIDLSNLDVRVSSRMPASDFLPPYRIIDPVYDGTKGEGATNGGNASDAAFAVGGAHIARSGSIHQTGEVRRAVWNVPEILPKQDVSISASLQWKAPGGVDFSSGTRAAAAMTATLYVGTDLDGTTDAGATSVLTATVAQHAQAAQPVASIDLTGPQRDFNTIMLKLEGGTVGQQNRAYLWNLKVEVDGQRYMLDRIRFVDRMTRAKIHTTAESAAFIEGGETLKTFARRSSTVATDWSGGRD